MKKTIYELELFEAVKISNKNNNVDEYIKRVPGGWLYIIDDSNCVVSFIPYKPNLNNNSKFKISNTWTSIGKKEDSIDEIDPKNLDKQHLI
jgi:hypothetical protein